MRALPASLRVRSAATTRVSRVRRVRRVRRDCVVSRVGVSVSGCVSDSVADSSLRHHQPHTSHLGHRPRHHPAAAHRGREVADASRAFRAAAAAAAAAAAGGGGEPWGSLSSAAHHL